MSITFPAGGPRSAGTAPTDAAQTSAAKALALMDKYDLIKEATSSQVQKLEDMNTRLRDLNQEKRALSENGGAADALDKQLALDVQIKGLSSMLAMEMTKLQALAAKMTQALDAASNVSGRPYNFGSGIISNMR